MKRGEFLFEAIIIYDLTIYDLRFIFWNLELIFQMELYPADGVKFLSEIGVNFLRNWELMSLGSWTTGIKNLPFGRLLLSADHRARFDIVFKRGDSE